MNSMIILQGISAQGLLVEIERIVEQKLTQKFAELQPKKSLEYKTRKEIAQLLNISLPTLNDWSKLGLITSYKIGNRVLYRTDEINEAVKKRKFHQF